MGLTKQIIINGCIKCFFFFLAEYTEDLLAMHEHQVEVMKSFYEQNKHLFKLVEKRATMFAKMEEYEVM